MRASDALLYALAASLAGAPLTLIVSRSKAVAGSLALLATAVSSGLAIYAAASVLLGGTSEAVTLVSLPSLGSSLRLEVDGLSAVFLILIGAIALLSALYSTKYLDHYPDLGAGRYYPHFLLFVAGMYGIVTLTDLMFFFFVIWQLMTIPSFALVRFEHTKRENVRAANRYLLMMEISCLLVMAGAWLLGGGPGGDPSLARFDFGRIGAALPGLFEENRGLVSLAFFLFLVGFGIKAGMWPFGQMWLPDAHPAAPSPVSALLSGVMIKTGVYGLARTFLWLVPLQAAGDYSSGSWGLLIAVLGTATLFIGTLQALRQEETKRLLAFHSIGQVGYILLGLGACLALLGPGLQDPGLLALASLAFYGALFHALNHGVFKSLLFLNAGSILSATGTQDLNRLGGLMRFMPLTGITALIASFSISGVPLMNGFASKWSIYVAGILGSRHAGYLAVCAVFAILTSTLTLASFVKFFGTSFLSRTSALVGERAREKGRLEVGLAMQIPQVALAIACVAMGMVPALAYGLIQAALAESQGGLGAVLARPELSAQSGIGAIPAAGGQALLAPLVLAALLGILILMTHFISRLGAVERRPAPPWLCGYVRESDVHRYGAHNLYGEVKRYISWVGGKRRIPEPDRVLSEGSERGGKAVP